MAATRKKPRKVDTGGERISLPPDTRAFLNPRQVCQALGISMRHFREMLSTAAYPPPDLKNHADLGRGLRWKVETHNAWCDARTAKGEG
jgi:predicted DNA-binding transcriptional regulator AlpA